MLRVCIPRYVRHGSHVVCHLYMYHLYVTHALPVTCLTCCVSHVSHMYRLLCASPVTCITCYTRHLLCMSNIVCHVVCVACYKCHVLHVSRLCVLVFYNISCGNIVGFYIICCADQVIFSCIVFNNLATLNYI